MNRTEKYRSKTKLEIDFIVIQVINDNLNTRKLLLERLRPLNPIRPKLKIKTKKIFFKKKKNRRYSTNRSSGLLPDKPTCPFGSIPFPTRRLWLYQEAELPRVFFVPKISSFFDFRTYLRRILDLGCSSPR